MIHLPFDAIAVPPPPADPAPSLGVRVPLNRVNESPDFKFYAHVTSRGNGTFTCSDWQTVRTFVFNSHSLKQVISSITRARSQITGNSTAIYIDVDPADLTQQSLNSYLRLLSSAIGKHLWRGGQNTRIGAVVVTAGPIRLDIDVAGMKIPYNQRFCFGAFNVKSPATGIRDIVIPAETVSLD